MTQKKKIGIFGGSFDPIHFGHLNMAISMLEACGLDTVFFVPAGLSPFKEEAPPLASPSHRVRMLELAIGKVPEFFLLDWEVNQQGPSYTIETVRRLARESHASLHLLIGEDHMTRFHHWKDVEELIRLSPPIVAGRPGSEKTKGAPLAKTLSGGKVEIPLFDISSTSVRQRLSQNKYCGHLVPASVLDYIEKHRLYLPL
jgi:nicotinate-nucleotide adenylyltransferase